MSRIISAAEGTPATPHSTLYSSPRGTRFRGAPQSPDPRAFYYSSSQSRQASRSRLKERRHIQCPTAPLLLKATPAGKRTTVVDSSRCREQRCADIDAVRSREGVRRADAAAAAKDATAACTGRGRWPTGGRCRRGTRLSSTRMAACVVLRSVDSNLHERSQAR